MDFAKRQLEKYGWQEGKGLGKNEDGMSTALKATLKFDSAGVGHEMGKDFTHKWWENVYDNAAKNIEVVEDERNIKVTRVANAEEVEITTKDYSVRDFKKKNSGMEYGTFLKTSKLTQDGVVNYANVHVPEEHTTQIRQLSDEDLFAICGGRTAHKGARHGLKLSGKLSRIEKQEKMLLKKMKKVHIGEDSPEQETCKKKLKKLKKLSEAVMEPDVLEVSSSDLSPLDKSKKKKKKRKKSVSFSETVLEYTVQEPNDESPGCSTMSVGKVEIHERQLSTPSPDNDHENVTTDEGIEQDCDVKHLDCGQECFSEMQSAKTEKKKKKSKKQEKDAEEVSIEISEVDLKERDKKKVRKRGLNVDIDRVKNMKKKKQRHNAIEEIDTSMVDLQISE